MAISIARRKFIVALGSTAVGWPLVARAAVPVIGYLGLLLDPGGCRAGAGCVSARAWAPAAYVEGQNVAIDYRWAHGQYDQLPALAFDLVLLRAERRLAALGTPASALAAKTATTTIPIVFVTGDDPVRIGLVDSLNRPGGNATGVYMLTSALEPKRLELIHELVPNTTAVGVIVDPSSPDTSLQMKELPAAASALGQQIKIFNARSEAEIDTAFAAIVEQRIGAVLVASSPSFLPRRQRFVALAAAHALPAVYFVRPFADVGGLMSYGTNIVEPFRQVGLYAGRILKGEKPADLPVQQSVKVELVINLKTAKVLGITVPLSLLGRADEVIE